MKVPPQRLFTPGPLNTSATVRAAADFDLGSRSPVAQALTARLRSDIAAIAACGEDYTVIPLQGSGTFAVEAMLCSMLAEDDHVLIIENGIYSARMSDICRVYDIRHSVLKCDHTVSFDLAAIESRLVELGDVTHLAAVHFETALGVLNDVDGLVAVAARHGCRALMDVISTFGAMPLHFGNGAVAAAALSASKCLHGVPGVAFVIADRRALRRLVRPRTLSLDLQAQQRALEDDGQWRFTPPLQVMLSLAQAIEELKAAGGQAARHRRYAALADQLVRGMAALGFEPVIEAAHRAPIIITFAPRPGLRCDITRLNDFLFERGLVIYPTKHWHPDSFRIGVIGELSSSDIDELLAAFASFREAAAVATSSDLTSR
jgi:2-aminoethylphosphonate-pyruvate transaminase